MDRLRMEAAAGSLAGLYAEENANGAASDDAERSKFDSNFLVRADPTVLADYVVRVKQQLVEGERETLQEIGIPLFGAPGQSGLTPDALDKSLEVHDKLMASVPAVSTLIERKDLGQGRQSAVLLIRDPPTEDDFIEVRITCVGNVDAGKSTMLGVLTHGALDDGRGAARQKLFRHKHEFDTGRTSSVGNDILGFDAQGNVLNKPNPHSHHLDWTAISKACSKMITFIDLAGHERYLKTTIFGMTGHAPDYTMLMIGSNAGIIGTTKEHLSLTLSLSVPVFIVVTKIDMCPPQILEETLKNILRLVKSSGARKLPIVVRTLDDVVQAAVNLPHKRVCPIFQVSNVTGTNVDLLKQFLNILPLRREPTVTDPVHFQIDDVYTVEGVGTVVSGTCMAGKIKVGDTLMLGPDAVGDFQAVPIKSVHRKRLPVGSVRAGQTASFSLRKIAKSDVRKGMVLLDPALKPKASLEFEADVLVLHHPTTIKPNYQAMVHIGAIRQTATLVSLSKQEVLRTGERDRVTFRFIRRPEYIREGTKMVFREGRTKAVGTVVRVVPKEEIVGGGGGGGLKTANLGGGNPAATRKQPGGGGGNAQGQGQQRPQQQVRDRRQTKKNVTGGGGGQQQQQQQHQGTQNSGAKTEKPTATEAGGTASG